jgi:chaperonin GroES
VRSLLPEGRLQRTRHASVVKRVKWVGIALSTPRALTLELLNYASIDMSLQNNTYYFQERSIMKIRPLHDRVIVKRLEEDRTSSGGIVIPDTAAEKPTRGRIVAVGKGRILENGQVRPCDVNVGDQILFGKYSGTEVKIEGEDVVVMREEDVMAVIESK